MNKSIQEVQRRWNQFNDEFDQDIDLVNEIHNGLGELLVPIVGWDATDCLFKSILDSASIPVGENQSPLGTASSLDISAKRTSTYRWIASVYLYANWGLERAPDDSLDNEFDRVGGFRESAPGGFFAFIAGCTSTSKFADALRAANARLIIDEGCGHVSLMPSELAALARIDVKTLRNALTPSGRRKSGLRIDHDGNITSESARTWLLARSDFLPTISGDISAQDPVRQSSIADEADVLFIPVADDGSAFTPDVHKDDGRYYVETAEGEIALTNYSEALRHLTVASVPAWRRPGPGGYTVK